MLAGVRVHVSPEEGDTSAEREIVPMKPLTGETVMVVEPVAPALTVTDEGLVVTVKSVTVNVTVAA
jgi:hypothetical protein